MAIICNHCQSTDVEHDVVAGNIICINCGAVLEENTIVSEIQFSESAAGASVLQGTFYSDKGRAPPISVFGARRFFQNDSREWTIANARSRIQALAYAVQLNDRHIEAAHRWYILALQHNFTRGRKSQHIAAACLYIVCRQEKTSHMLLDFSDVLQTNVYELGSMYLRLCRLLSLDIPLIDPSLFIGRFASKLDLGDKTQIVANTALRLVSRMKRDWIQTGRRPSGVCGACLLIASRVYGFSRTQKDIINVVRVCDMTLRKRLQEFGETPSAKLTPEEFHGVWLEQEIDPPSFTQSKNKEKDHKLSGDIFIQDNLAVTYPNSEIFTSSLHFDPGLTSQQDLDDMDFDREVSDALLNDIEIDEKTELWVKLNHDYITAQDEKAKLLKEQQEKGIVKNTPKKRRRRDAQSKSSLGLTTSEPAASASEAAKQFMQTKKLSKKFNYEALDSLLSSQPIKSLATLIDMNTEPIAALE